MAFLFLFLPFIFSRLELRVAVVTTRRRAPAHLHHKWEPANVDLSSPGAAFFAVGNTTTKTTTTERGKGGRGSWRRGREKGREGRTKTHQEFRPWQCCFLRKEERKAQGSEVAPQGSEPLPK